MTFYHYTCDHGATEIQRRNNQMMLRPMADPLGLVWLTNLEWPIARTLGLTRNHIKCDRTEHRFRVMDDSNVISWLDFTKEHVTAEQLPHAWELELTPGVMVRHWFVSLSPVPVLYDPIRRKS